MLIDGVLVPACSLVNGTTITVYDAPERDSLQFFHIKLERHDVLYAEGAPCETLFGTDENAMDFSEYLRRYGLGAIDDARCAPLLGVIDGGPREIRSRLRSALSPWIERREKIDIIRDGLEERGIALLRQAEFGASAPP